MRRAWETPVGLRPPSISHAAHRTIRPLSSSVYLSLGSSDLLSPDTKIKANASRHKALSWKRAQALERQLQGEVDELMRLAEQADHRARPEQLDLPEELARREKRLAAIRRAQREIETRARHRQEHEKAAYEAKLADRQEREKKTGKKPGGRPPEPPVSGPRGSRSGESHG